MQTKICDAGAVVKTILILSLCALFGQSRALSDTVETGSRIDLRIVTDQAEAALDILDKRARGDAVSEADWRRHRETEGYRRLEKRQESFGDTELDAKLRQFLGESAEALELREALRRTVESWHRLDLKIAGERALAYLPQGSLLRGSIYPVIKHTTNSFVFEIETDPAIFLYVDPEIDQPKLANTLAHELHHIGSSRNCPDPEGYEELDENARSAVDWLTGFGEGLAMLAAAGGADVDPHASSDADERAVWRRNLANFDDDLKRLEAFFLAIAGGTLSEDERRRQGFAFINTDEAPQGAFYTVGWRMAATIERSRGRHPVIRSVCDPRILLTAYNRVAAASDTRAGKDLWSQELIDRLYGREPSTRESADPEDVASMSSDEQGP